MVHKTLINNEARVGRMSLRYPPNVSLTIYANANYNLF